MRLTAILLLSAALAASASGNSQTVTLDLKDVPIQKVFREVIRQTGTSIIYNEAYFKNASSITIKVKDATVSEVLGKCLRGLPFTFDLEGNTIIVKKRQAIFKENVIPVEEPFLIDVHGKVVNEKGEPLEGVTVLVKETNNGTQTNALGYFSLKVSSDNIVIVFSIIGYETREEKVDGKITLNIVLKKKDLGMNEVVVTGYQTLERNRASGAFSYMGEKEIANRPAVDLSSAMDGMFTGLRVNQQGQFTIRGVGTMTSSVEDPLLVVDGFAIEGGLSTINPNDVQSIHVLKDAAAASIWGARASNGVIVITTKKAKKGLHVDVNLFTDIQEKLDLDKVNPIAGSADALRWERFLWENNQVFSSFSLSAGVDGNNNPVSMGVQLLKMRDDGDLSQAQFEQRWSELQQTDYRRGVNDLLLQNPVTQNYDLTISGSSEKNDFVLNTRYVGERMGIRDNNSHQMLINLRNNYRITPWLETHLSVMTNFTRSDNSGASLGEIRNISPYENLLDDNGDYATMVGAHYQEFIDSTGVYFPEDWNYNLLQETNNRSFKSEQNDIRIQTGLTFKIVKGLVFETKFQYENYKRQNRRYYTKDSYYVRDQRNKWVEYDQVNNQVLNEFIPEGGQLVQNFGTTKGYTFRNKLGYNREFGDHFITAGFFTEVSSKEVENFSPATVYGYDDDKLTSKVPNVYFPIESYWGGMNYQLSGMNSNLSYLNDRLFSLIGNAAYTYKNKYSLNGSFRTDASNLIVKNSRDRYSPFWSVGGNWQMGQENFLKDIKALNRLNLRLSYGYSGNVVLSTASVPLISFEGTYPLTGAEYATIANYGNPDLKWERTRIVNFGIDYALFSDRLFGSIEVYNKHGKDIVGSVDLPSVTGTTSESFNTAEIINKGFEISLNTVLPVSSKVTWNSRVNFSRNTSNVRSLSIVNYDYFAIRNPHFEQGKPVDALYSYTFLGMNEDNVPGLQGVGDDTFTFDDVQPSTIDDREYMEYSGSRQPTDLLGWQNSFSGFGFRLSAMITGEFGNVFRRPTFDYFVLAGGKSSSTIHKDAVSVLNGTQEGIPAMPSGDALNLRNWRNYAPYLAATIEDASHIRLSEVNLSYTLRADITSRMGFINARIYAQVRNLGLLWAANDEGLDPLFVSTGTPPRIYKFGLALGF